jgi:hypothetical protein
MYFIFKKSHRAPSAALLLVFGAVSVLALSGCDKTKPRGPIPNATAALEYREALAAGGGGPSASAQATPQRTGWATLRGSITVEGDPPKPGPLNITKDQQVCDPGGGPVLSEAIEFDPSTRGLSNFILYTTDLDGDNVHPDMQGGKIEPIDYDQKQCRFKSHVLVMQTTQSLNMTNSDPVPHNTKIDGTRAKSINLTISPGSAEGYSPGRAERAPIPATCSIHPWMIAYILPLDNSYGAVSAKDGTFEIPNLPAGVKLKMRVWHESINNFKDVTIGGSPVKGGSFALTLDKDEVRDLKITIPASAFN